MKLLFLILSFFTYLEPCVFSASYRVNEILAKTNLTAITSRDVLISDLLEAFLEKRDFLPSESNEDKILSVNTAILDRMIFEEAKQFGFIDESHIITLTDKNIQDLRNNLYIKPYEVKKGELLAAWRIKQVVKAFLKTKEQSFVSLLSDSEIQAYYDKNRIKFGNVPFQDLKENIKTFLLKEQREERLKEWIELLKKKYKAQNYMLDKSPFKKNIKDKLKK